MKIINKTYRIWMRQRRSYRTNAISLRTLYLRTRIKMKRNNRPPSLLIKWKSDYYNGISRGG